MAALHNYIQAREYIEKEHPGWLRVLIPRTINAPAHYWSQKVLAISAINAAMMNIRFKEDLRQAPNPTSVAIQTQMSVLLQFGVPTFYVSKDFMLAALRTELPQDMLLEGIPFPFPGMVFMLPKGFIRHPEEGDCPYIALSKHSKGASHDLPIYDLSCPTTVPRDMIIASTYMPEARVNVNYFKSVPILVGKSIAECFQDADNTAFSLHVSDAFLAPQEDQIDLSAEDFIDRLWLLALTLSLIMSSGENLLEPGILLKRVQPKNRSARAIEFWSPHYLGRDFRVQGEPGDPTDPGNRKIRPHWKRGHIKSQPYGPKHSLRKVIWLQPYQTGVFGA